METTKKGMEIIADVAFVFACYLFAVILAAWLIPAEAWIFGKPTPWIVAIAAAVFAGKWARRHKWFT